MLPPPREELSLYPGPPDLNGWPSWTLYDPVRNRYFRLGWPVFEILARWDLGEPDAIIETVCAQTTLSVDEQDVSDVLRFLSVNQLLRPRTTTAVASLVARAKAEKLSVFQWLLHHYLFIRIPLVRPDRFLAETLQWVRWVLTPAFFWATLMALAAGLFLVHRQWETFDATLMDTMTPTGLAGYGATLVGVKFVHELAHAYSAKRLGCRVPTMGIAFLVMVPMLYTDVNETWKLPRRRDRLAVGAAGVMAELAVAAWSTALWAFLPDGPLRQAAFMLCTTTWVASVLINLSPFMRFDGYFLLMDALEMPNLHGRAFAAARWWLREVLFALHEPPPEHFAPKVTRRLVAFAFLVWAYRLSLFMGIAALVYHFFIKVVGVGLFAVEIGWFVVMPVTLEIKEWLRRKDALLASRRTLWSFCFALALVLALVVPWHTHVSAPALLKAPRTAGLYAVTGARLARMLVHQGQTVSAGQKLIILEQPDFDDQQVSTAARLASLRYQLAGIGFDAGFRQQSGVLRQELAAAQAENESIQAQQARLIITAPFDGIVTDVLPDLHPGDWVSPRDRLATVKVVTGMAVVEAYISEDDLVRITEGDSARFLAETGGWNSLPCQVVAIDRSPVRLLADPELAKSYGGGIAVRGKESALVPEGAIYRVHLSTGNGVVSAQLRGQVRIEGRAESLIIRGLRSAMTVILREWGE
ncbi:MAG: HlyD family efflux transporter periplasmic adaptor subunit [Rhodopila sp.]